MILENCLGIKSEKEKKVFVALSGGIDSAVAAALLQKKGYKVTGCFMRLHDQDTESIESSEKSALAVASCLGIDFMVFDFRKEFKEIIIDSFLQDYQKGLTPNPCVLCNEKIKFDLFWKKAQENGADLMATGHYARIKKNNGLPGLYRAKDKIKDQSYFLWRLKEEQLKRILFPLGNYRKKEVKRMAQRLSLKTIERKESMEICFISGKIEEFLNNNLRVSPGSIIDSNGKIIGRHKGLPFYTIGQRKGIRLSGGPYYVHKKNMKDNALIVSKDKESLGEKQLFCHQINWINVRNIKCPIEVMAQIRYLRKPARATVLKKQNGVYEVIFKFDESAITPGQSVVFYHRAKLLGGGIIMLNNNV